MKAFKIHTDGACWPNPGPGAWAAVIEDVGTGESSEISGSVDNTTNNRMELLAAIMALQKIPLGSSVAVFTDSQYLRTGITSWVNKWKRNQWMRKQKRIGMVPVKNRDLWMLLDEVRTKHNVTWHWVRGHNGDPMNERANTLAENAARNGYQKNPCRW